MELDHPVHWIVEHGVPQHLYHPICQLQHFQAKTEKGVPKIHSVLSQKTYRSSITPEPSYSCPLNQVQYIILNVLVPAT